MWVVRKGKLHWMDPYLSSITFSFSLLLAAYLIALCSTPPNIVTTVYVNANNRIQLLSGWLLLISSHAGSLAILGHAAGSLRHSERDIALFLHICSLSESATPALFSSLFSRLATNAETPGCLVLILLGASIRLHAFWNLHDNFTFKMTVPDRLVTTGIYQVMQHPSYTGLILMWLGTAQLVINRWNMVVGCWLPAQAVQVLCAWRWTIGFFCAFVAFTVTIIRVDNEENMLREMFGREWERWNQETARFIPGIF